MDMELKDFITESLVQIQEGVQAAIDHRVETPKAAGVINPVWDSALNISRQDIQNVEFDVAVTIADKTINNANGGIRVCAIQLGASHDQSVELSSVTRIKFSVPVILPVHIVTAE